MITIFGKPNEKVIEESKRGLWNEDLLYAFISRAKRLIIYGNNPEVKKTYQEALDATRKARENICRFVETYSHEYPHAAEAEWSRAGST
jgi:hypothetical protein